MTNAQFGAGRAAIAPASLLLVVAAIPAGFARQHRRSAGRGSGAAAHRSHLILFQAAEGVAAWVGTRRRHHSC